MFSSIRARRRSDGASATIEIAPLIDVVFILLIFFLVTTSFVGDTGIEVRRPVAVTSAALEPSGFRVSVAASGALYAGGERVRLEELEERVRRFVGGGGRAVVVIADERTPSGRLVAAMDAARRGGAGDVAVASRAAEEAP